MPTIEEPKIVLPEGVEDVLKLVAVGADYRQLHEQLGTTPQEAQGLVDATMTVFDGRTLAQAMYKATRVKALEIPKRTPNFELTYKQHSVLGFVALGHTNSEIGSEFGFSQNEFARNHIKGACKKLGARTRESAVVRGVQFGFLDDDFLRNIRANSRVLYED